MKKQPAIRMKTQYDEKCVAWDTKAGDLLWQMPPDCTTDLQWEHQSNNKFKDFNFSLKPVTVADETLDLSFDRLAYKTHRCCVRLTYLP